MIVIQKEVVISCYSIIINCQAFSASNIFLSPEISICFCIRSILTVISCSSKSIPNFSKPTRIKI
nr:MAG TPA: hypothetical protein [Bacteriophage sp.]